MLLGRQGSRSCGYFNAKMRGSRRTAKSDRSKAALLLKSRVGPKWEKMMRARAELHRRRQRRRARRRKPQLRSRLCLQLLTLLPSRLSCGLWQMMSWVPRRLIQAPPKEMELWEAPSIARTGLQRQRQRRCQLQLHLMVKFLRLVTLCLLVMIVGLDLAGTINTVISD